MQITSYENKAGSHADFWGKISEKSVYYTRQVNSFICDILYMIHSWKQFSS